MTIDLTGGEHKVIGNKGDTHLFRLSNAVGDDNNMIEEDGEYSADFVTDLARSTPVPVVLNLTELATGSLVFPVTIETGFYRVRRINPTRTLLTLEVEAR